MISASLLMLSIEDGKKSLNFYLTINDMDLFLKEKNPPTLTFESTTIHNSPGDKWKQSNSL